jgi:adenylosuccinate synthase
VLNDYQGSLRFAWLDLDLLRWAVAADLADADRVPSLVIEPCLVVSCLDQLGEEPIVYYQGGRQQQVGLAAFATMIMDSLGMNLMACSFGAMRNAVFS